MKTTTTLALAALLAAPLALRAAEEKPLPKELPPFGPDKPLVVPKIDQSKLPSGLTVWLISRTGYPKVTALLTVRGGTAADPKPMEGLSEVLADTLKEGTKTRSSKQIVEELQKVGGSIEAAASDDALQVTIDGLGTGTTTVLNVLADVARNAAFPPNEVELAKQNALQNLEVRASNPDFVAGKAFARAVYGEHPYHVVAPSEEALKALTPEILRKEYARRFRPDRALLVVIGDFDLASAKATIGKAFGGWTAAGEAPGATPDAPKASKHEILVVNRPGSVQSVILVGRPTLKATDADYYPLVVANTIFGGSFGARLTKNIREDKGYTYSPSSQAGTQQAGGLLRVKASVRNEVTAATLNEIFYELDRMATTNATEDEVTTAKRYQAGLYLIRNQIQGSVARTLAANWIKGLPPEELGAFVPKIRAVTPEQIRHAGMTYFPSRTQTVVVVGDVGKVEPELAPFGAVSVQK
jgi:predicted Zn-dependent peptidase